jgi:hypothetical protein
MVEEIKKQTVMSVFDERNIVNGFDKKFRILEINLLYTYSFDINWSMVCEGITFYKLAKKLIIVLFTSKVTLSFKPERILLLNSYSPG